MSLIPLGGGAIAGDDGATDSTIYEFSTVAVAAGASVAVADAGAADARTVALYAAASVVPQIEISRGLVVVIHSVSTLSVKYTLFRYVITALSPGASMVSGLRILQSVQAAIASAATVLASALKDIISVPQIVAQAELSVSGDASDVQSTFSIEAGTNMTVVAAGLPTPDADAPDVEVFAKTVQHQVFIKA